MWSVVWDRKLVSSTQASAWLQYHYHISIIYLRLSEWFVGSSPQNCLYRFESDTGVKYKSSFYLVSIEGTDKAQIDDSREETYILGRCSSGPRERSAKP